MLRVATPSTLSLLIISCSLLPSAECSGQIDALPKISQQPRPEADWLIAPTNFRAGVFRTESAHEIALDNGLIRRTFRLAPNGATVAFDNLITSQSMLRGVKPEAVVSIDGRQLQVGGLTGQPNYAYLLPEWLDEMETDEGAMQFVRFSVDKPKERFLWKRSRHHQADANWPPTGAYLRMDYRMPVDTPELEASDDDSLKADKTPLSDMATHGVTVSVHYELYDGLPALSKWITVQNKTSKPVTVDRFTSELLAVVEHASLVESREEVPLPRPEILHVETDFAFGGMSHQNANRHVVHWRADPQYTSQVNYKRETPCLLAVEPTNGPAQTVAPGETFESFRTFELVYDSSDRERRGLALRRMYRTIAPWVTENPLMHHLLNSNPQQVKTAVDQAAEVGFEMIILSFGSGFDMDNDDPAYLTAWKDVADYAHTKGIEIGSYSLLSSRGAPAGNMIVSPNGQQPTHGRCPALTSKWGQDYIKRMRTFFDKTGFDLLEHDGSYPGDVDVTARPPLQKGQQDSRWVQWRIITDYYKWCREKGIFLNVPDYYFLSGANKTGMGYREVNWSLPRAMQVIHTRQNIFDGTWTKSPGMGWMFVPLSQYHGGGAAATIEPLDQHLDHYQRMIDCNLALGVQACYRGPRLFDTERTQSLLKERVAWFKQYRNILESDLIHGRRADGRDIDWMLHVNPSLKRKGMLVVFNPLHRTVSRKLSVNLYYTGLTDEVTATNVEGKQQSLVLKRDYTVDVQVDVPAEGMSWYVLD